LQYKDFSEKLEVVSAKKLSRLALLPVVEGRKEKISRSFAET